MAWFESYCCPFLTQRPSASIWLNCGDKNGVLFCIFEKNGPMKPPADNRTKQLLLRDGIWIWFGFSGPHNLQFCLFTYPSWKWISWEENTLGRKVRLLFLISNQQKYDAVELIPFCKNGSVNEDVKAGVSVTVCCERHLVVP